MTTNNENSASASGNVPKAKIDLDEKYLYCVPILDGDISSSENFQILAKGKRLYDAELKVIKRLVAKSYRCAQEENQKESVAMIGKSRFLLPATPNAKARRERTEVVNLDSDFSAVVICWRGRGSPPDGLHLGPAATTYPYLGLQDALIDSPYERIRTDAEAEPTHLRYRWTKAALFHKKSDLTDEKILKDIHRSLLRDGIKTDQAQFDIHHVPLVIQRTEVTLRQALLQTHWATGTNAADQARWHEILQVLRPSRPPQEHGETVSDRFRECNKQLSVMHRHVGSSHGLYLSSPSASSRFDDMRSTTLFGPSSVAHVMLEQKEQSGTLLRVKLVELKLNGEKVEKRIESVCPIRCLDAAEHQKHALWRGKTGYKLRYPDLPCLNLGSKFKWSLLPPEKAKLLPVNSAVRDGPLPWEHSFQDPTNTAQHQDPSRIKLLTTSVRFAQLDLDKMIKHCIQRKHSVVFVVSQKTFQNHALLKSFRSWVRQLVGDDSHSRVVLLPDQLDRDMVPLWKSQLAKVKGALMQYNTEIRPITVVVLGSDERQAFFYKTIKTLCETDIGLQSYAVRFNTIEQKEARQAGSGALMTAKILAKKIAVRNPPTPGKLQSEDFLSIAVAVHIEKIVVRSPTPREDGTCNSGSGSSKTLYVVVFASKDAEKSERYLTSVQLIGHASLHKKPLANRLADFVSDTVKDVDQDRLNRIVLFRSGHVPESSGSSRAQVGRELHNALPELKNTSGLVDKNRMINTEVSHFNDEISHVVGSQAAVSYMLLSESHDPATANVIRQKLASNLGAANREKPCQPCFLTGTAIDNRDIIHVQVGKSLVNLTMFNDKIADDPLTDDRTDSPLAVRQSEDQQKAQQKKSSTTDDLYKITPNFLAKLWHDQRLDQSKWPVVTYLAHLAAKRARLHLRYDNFNADDDDELAPCYLKQVHDDVKDTLCFV